MPGQSVKSNVSGNVFALEKAVGDRVEAGEAIVIIESMKMEFAAESPIEGVVEAILVQPGDPVADGQVVATVTG